MPLLGLDLIPNNKAIQQTVFLYTTKILPYPDWTILFYKVDRGRELARWQ